MILQGSEEVKNITGYESWFQLEIYLGLEKLARLGLNRGPRTPQETERLSDTWADALWPGIAWNKTEDTPRIREAFRRLTAGHRHDEGGQARFPRVEEFKSAMPRRRALMIESGPRGRPLTDEEKRRRWRAIREWERAGCNQNPPPADLFPITHAAWLVTHGAQAEAEAKE